MYTNVEVTGGNVGDQSGWNPVQTAYWQSGEKYRFGAYSDGNSKIENENVDFIEGEQKLTFTDYTANKLFRSIDCTEQKGIPDNCESSRREKRNYYAGGRTASGSK